LVNPWPRGASRGHASALAFAQVANIETRNRNIELAIGAQKMLPEIPLWVKKGSANFNWCKLQLFINLL